ncbi:MAG: hypothetical protein J1F67_07850 [Muribaculaceae bacterium]|nr:hypothetical protein [Muribaculaceae bacterium]
MTIDLPFRSPSSASDFSCKDGEITSLIPYPSSGSLITPDIDFAIVRDRLPGWHLHPDQYPMKTLIASDPSMEYWTSLGAQLLSQFQSEAANQGLFVSPFYVMAAWKTYEGYHLSPTRPVLLTPNSEVPLVATDGDINATELEFKIAAAVCSLYFRMRAPEVLRDWVGIIESLDIFVSEPLYSYNTFKAFLPYKHVTTDNSCECLDLNSGEITTKRICTDTLTLAWKANLGGTGMGDTHSSIFAMLISTNGLTMSSGSATKDKELGVERLHMIRIASVPLSEVDLKDKWSPLSFINEPQPLPNNTVTLKEGQELIIQGMDREISLSTRPLKLTKAGEFKRLVRAYLRGNFTPENLTFSFYGSYDMLTWWKISERKGGAVLAFPSSRFRFFRAEVKGILASGENLQGISIEYK